MILFTLITLILFIMLVSAFLDTFDLYDDARGLFKALIQRATRKIKEGEK